MEQEDDEFQGVEGVSRAALAPAAAPRYPHQGAATIVCDGRGGYRVHLGWAATFGCGIADCVRDHELSHISDWQGRWPNGCKNADGTSKRDGTAVPVGGDGYDAFLRRSECTAYTGGGALRGAPPGRRLGRVQAPGAGRPRRHQAPEDRLLRCLRRCLRGAWAARTRPPWCRRRPSTPAARGGK